jgi:hypothetical protein
MRGGGEFNSGLGKCGLVSVLALAERVTVVAVVLLMGGNEEERRLKGRMSLEGWI